jgi:hypothetical protein
MLPLVASSSMTPYAAGYEGGILFRALLSPLLADGNANLRSGTSMFVGYILIQLRSR